MAGNARQFNAEIMRWLEHDMPQRVVQFQRKVGFEALSRIVKRTPVDTGRARGNNQVTIGAAAEGELSTTDRGGGTTISAGRGVMRAMQPFQSLFITNNVPYILVLEEGKFPLDVKRGTYVKQKYLRQRKKSAAAKAGTAPNYYEIRSSGGFSKQAPQGMYAITAQELADYTER